MAYVGVPQGKSIYGTGIDTNITVSGTTTQTQDMYWDSVVVANGGTLNPNGFRTFAKTSIVVQSGGLITTSGNAGAANGTPGAARGSSGTVGAGAVGGTGATGVGGNGGASSFYIFAGVGNKGGNGSGGGGGSGGALSLVPAAQGGQNCIVTLPYALLGTTVGTLNQVSGSSGGGGGGGDTVNKGGGGGGGAARMMLITPSLTGSGTISANGGNGGTPLTGNCGGGGGGGASDILLITGNDTTQTSLTFTVTGGVKGNGVGSGTAGTDGSAGRITRIQNYVGTGT